MKRLVRTRKLNAGEVSRNKKVRKAVQKDFPPAVKKKNLTIKWREHGRWVKSQCRFFTRAGCERHAEIIGARTYKVIKASEKP